MVLNRLQPRSAAWIKARGSYNSYPKALISAAKCCSTRAFVLRKLNYLAGAGVGLWHAFQEGRVGSLGAFT